MTYYIHRRGFNYFINSQWETSQVAFYHCEEDAFKEMRRRQNRADIAKTFLQTLAALFVLASIAIVPQ